MSFKLGGIIVEDLVRGLTAYEKLILIAYASFAQADGSSIFPAQATIADMARCSTREVRNALTRFIDNGVMIYVGKKGLRKEYRLDIRRAVELYGRVEKAEQCSGVGEAEAERGSGSTVAPGSGDAEQDSAKAERGSGIAERGSRNPSINPLKNPIMNPGAPEAGEAEAPAPDAPWKRRWQDCQAELEAAVGEEVYKVWFPAIWRAECFPTRIVLAVPSSFLRDQIAEYQAVIEEVVGVTVEYEILSAREAAA